MLLGQAERAAQNWFICERLQSKAVSLFAEVGDWRLWVMCNLALAATKLFQGGFVSTALILSRCETLSEESADAARAARGKRLKALLLTRQGRLVPARTALREAATLTLRTPDPRSRALLCEYTGEFRLAGGYLSRARRWLQRGYALAYRIPERDIMGETQRLLAEVEFQSKNTDHALELAEESLSAFEKMEDLYEVAVCRRVRGGILLHLGRTTEAIRDLERAVDFFIQMGERCEIYRAQRLLALARGEAIDDADTLIATLGRSYDAEGARLRAELEANEVDPIADLLNQPFQSTRGSAALGGAQEAGSDPSLDPGADGISPAPPNPTWPLTRAQIEESISLARVRTIQVLRGASNPGFLSCMARARSSAPRCSKSASSPRPISRS
ncbi:MAG: tetratricopeptide repeat protein [Candidatus Eisenbacteria bacterium]|nr:tetratricopeptide repeat protein [Candidatus Eisenbacteria bacterium]